MKMSPAIQELIDACAICPVGPKSAQRMTLHLSRDREAAESLGEALLNALSACSNVSVEMVTELNICEVCGDPKRMTHCFASLKRQRTSRHRTYGKLSRAVLRSHGAFVAPRWYWSARVGIGQLEGLLAEEAISEVILATNPTVEGEATGHYIADMASRNDIVVSRIAHGVPLGVSLNTSTRQHLLMRSVEER